MEAKKRGGKKGEVSILTVVAASIVILSAGIILINNLPESFGGITGLFIGIQSNGVGYGYGVDFGDAPDSTNNHENTKMAAYPLGGPPGVLANFPTVSSTIPRGPCHGEPICVWLGGNISFETNDADLEADDDGFLNLYPPEDASNQDFYDDGLNTSLEGSLSLDNCTYSNITFKVNFDCDGGFDNYLFNVWFDWNRDGDWNDTLEGVCDGENVSEWAVRDQIIGLSPYTPPIIINFTSDNFLPYNPDENHTWMRMVLSPVNVTTISNCTELQNMQNNLNQDYILLNDIDCDVFPYNISPGFSPIGAAGIEFEGTFNGRNHTISGLFINRAFADYVGLFGYAYYADIKNVILEDVNISGDGRVGGLVGSNLRANISGVSVNGIVYGTNHVGGLVGYNSESAIVSSHFVGGVNGASSTGGLVGYNHRSDIDSSYFIGNVDGTSSSTGGLVGYNDGASYAVSLINNSYSHANVTGHNFVGGLVGDNRDYGRINNSYSVGSVSGYQISIGGLVGYASGTGLIIQNSFTTSNVTNTTSSTSVGSVFGGKGTGIFTNNYWNNHSGNPDDCYPGGNTDCTAKQDDEDYFKGDVSSSQPMSNWDFDNIWQNNTDDYPSLISYPLSSSEQRISTDMNPDGSRNISGCFSDGETEDYYIITCIDRDGDGFNGNSATNCGAFDCDDYDAEVNPNAVEICDGIDNDCDGLVDQEPLDCSESEIAQGMISYWDMNDINDGTELAELRSTCLYTEDTKRNEGIGWPNFYGAWQHHGVWRSEWQEPYPCTYYHCVDEYDLQPYDNIYHVGGPICYDYHALEGNTDAYWRYGIPPPITVWGPLPGAQYQPGPDERRDKVYLQFGQCADFPQGYYAISDSRYNYGNRQWEEDCSNPPYGRPQFGISYRKESIGANLAVDSIDSNDGKLIEGNPGAENCSYPGCWALSCYSCPPMPIGPSYCGCPDPAKSWYVYEYDPWEVGACDYQSARYGYCPAGCCAPCAPNCVLAGQSLPPYFDAPGYLDRYVDLIHKEFIEARDEQERGQEFDLSWLEFFERTIRPEFHLVRPDFEDPDRDMREPWRPQAPRAQYTDFALQFHGDGDYMEANLTGNIPAPNESQTIALAYKIEENSSLYSSSTFYTLIAIYNNLTLGDPNSSISIQINNESLSVTTHNNTILVNASLPPLFEDRGFIRFSQPGELIHVVYTYNEISGRNILYLNGREVDNSTVIPDNDTPTILRLAKNWTGAISFNGTIDEVAIWNRTLTPTEVDFIYNAELGYCGIKELCKAADLVVWDETDKRDLPFADGQGRAAAEPVKSFANYTLIYSKE